MLSLRARYHTTKFDVANGAPVPDAVLRCEEALAGVSIILPPSGLRGFVPGAGPGVGAGGVGARDPRAYIQT